MTKKYYLSIASIFKNESWGLKEWLEHYRFHGVDHVYLVNDFSDDDYISILKPFIEDGFVTLYQNDNPVRYTGRQIDINNKFFIPIIKESQWVAQVDCDEYLFSPKTIDIKNILSKYERYSAVTANWVWFNGNGHIKQPSSIVKGFTKRCDYDATANIINPVGHPETTRFDAPKVIINSDYDILSFDVHTVRIKSGGELINISHISNREDPELLINHYQLQSREYWENVKMYRGDMNHIFLGNPRNFELYDAMNLGDIEDTRLWDQNKSIDSGYNGIIGMNNLGRNGRLGNQMFQYAALVGIAKQCGFDFRIPDHSDAPHFDYKSGPNIITEYHQLQHCFDMIHCEDRYGLIDGDEVELHESHEFCEDLFKECPNHITLNGYFQSEKYFKNVEKLIRLDFKFKKNIISEVHKHFGKYLDQKPVSILVRDFNSEFDYPNCENNHINIPLEYYKKCIDILGKDRTYIICSNNIDMCKQYDIFQGDNFIFNDIISDDIYKAHFDLCLISSCQDFVISNSTFGWWGAWLGTGENKRVFIPDPWYGPGLSHINTDDLYPEQWEVVKW